MPGSVSRVPGSSQELLKVSQSQAQRPRTSDSARFEILGVSLRESLLVVLSESWILLVVLRKSLLVALRMSFSSEVPGFSLGPRL